MGLNSIGPNGLRALCSAMESNVTVQTLYLHANPCEEDAPLMGVLNAALKRIERGTYGICEECSEKIPTKRLEAYLAARLCVSCKGRLEKVRRG